MTCEPPNALHSSQNLTALRPQRHCYVPRVQRCLSGRVHNLPLQVRGHARGILLRHPRHAGGRIGPELGHQAARHEHRQCGARLRSPFPSCIPRTVGLTVCAPQVLTLSIVTLTKSCCKAVDCTYDESLGVSTLDASCFFERSSVKSNVELPKSRRGHSGPISPIIATI